MKKFFTKQGEILIILFLYLLSSLLTMSKYLATWDAGQFALGTVNYNLMIHQPHPPGYFLFVYAGKALNFLLHDINSSFVLLNVLTGLFTVYFFYKLILIIAENRRTSFWLTLFFMFNPLFWYYHNVALTYTFEALAIVLIGYLTYLAIIKEKNYFLISLILSAVLIGFRQSIILTILPFLLIQFCYLRNKLKNLGYGLAVFIFVNLLWFIPFALLSGGIIPSLKFSLIQFNTVSPATKHIWLNTSQIKFFIVSVFWGFNIGYLIVLASLKGNWLYFKQRRKLFLLMVPVVWLTLFYLFIHLGAVGYLLAFLPLLYVLLIYPFNKLTGSLTGKILIVMMIISQVFLFLQPTPIFRNKRINEANYQWIIDHDNHFQESLRAARKYPPADLLLITLRGQYFDQNKKVEIYPYDDIRATSYYLPEYEIYDFLGVKGLYFLANGYQTEEKHGLIIYYPTQTKKLLILADYLHPTVYPKGVEVSPGQPVGNSVIYYNGDLSGVNGFEFNGFKFIRK